MKLKNIVLILSILCTNTLFADDLFGEFLEIAGSINKLERTGRRFNINTLVANHKRLKEIASLLQGWKKRCAEHTMEYFLDEKLDTLYNRKKQLKPRKKAKSDRS